MGLSKQQKAVISANIDDRTQKVLKGIIDSYITDSEAVGSRTLSKQLDVNLSPATIRNIMVDLSDMGYLEQPHTSAGRIPTNKAFRFYVDSLAVADSLPEKIQGMIAQISNNGAGQVEQLLVSTTRILANLTEFICVISAPKAEVSHLQRIEFLKVNSREVLVILITKSGLIRNKIIESSEPLSQNFLNSVAEFLNKEFQNASLLEIRKQILESMVEDKERYDTLLAQAVRLGKKAFELDSPPAMYMEGQIETLLNFKFKKQETVKSLISAFEQKNTMMDIVDRTLQADRIQIFIGEENKVEGLEDCSLVTAGYGLDNNVLGMVGVIGPTSMNYKRIIPVVDYTAKILSASIAEHAHLDDHLFINKK
ncbi:MAG: heat-inducible transcription repressor HrcA [SAR324 cluster bacterium]|nr:heat-inducible transcription repressor HrcA [SAR324 cluster bacterium]